MSLPFHQWPWIKVMTLAWVQCNNSEKYYFSSWTEWKVMTRTMSKTTMGILTLNFDQWPWIKVLTLPCFNVTLLWNIIPTYAFSENLWPGQCLNHYEPGDIDLWPITLNQGQATSVGPGQQSCEILLKFLKRVVSYGPDKLFACLNHYVYCDLDLWPVTLDQGRNTFLGPV
jgi:hypothetical protein